MKQKRWRKSKRALCLSWDFHFLLPLNTGTPNLELLSLDLYYTISFLRPPAYKQQALGLLSLLNQVSHFLIINHICESIYNSYMYIWFYIMNHICVYLYIHLYIKITLILFPWKIQTNTEDKYLIISSWGRENIIIYSVYQFL